MPLLPANPLPDGWNWAVSVRGTTVVSVIEQLPAPFDRSPVQLSTPSLTVTDPVGVPTDEVTLN